MITRGYFQNTLYSANFGITRMKWQCMSFHKNEETLLGQILMHPKLWNLHGDVSWYFESAIESPYGPIWMQLTLVQSPSYSVALFRLSRRFVMSASILAEANKLKIEARRRMHNGLTLWCSVHEPSSTQVKYTHTWLQQWINWGGRYILGAFGEKVICLGSIDKGPHTHPISGPRQMLCNWHDNHILYSTLVKIVHSETTWARRRLDNHHKQIIGVAVWAHGQLSIWIQ